MSGKGGGVGGFLKFSFIITLENLKTDIYQESGNKKGSIYNYF